MRDGLPHIHTSYVLWSTHFSNLFLVFFCSWTRLDVILARYPTKFRRIRLRIRSRTLSKPITFSSKMISDTWFFQTWYKSYELVHTRTYIRKNHTSSYIFDSNKPSHCGTNLSAVPQNAEKLSSVGVLEQLCSNMKKRVWGTREPTNVAT